MCEEKKDNSNIQSTNKAWFEKDISEWTEDDEQEAFLNITQTLQ